MPKQSPIITAMPFFTPYKALWVSTKILSGPGAIAKIKEANAKEVVQLETWWDPKNCTYIDPQV